LAGAVDKLPNLVPEKPTAGNKAQANTLRATGTDGTDPPPKSGEGSFVCPPFARATVSGRLRLAPVGEPDAADGGKAQRIEPLKNQGSERGSQDFSIISSEGD
jgi:hypothetical protein